MKWYIQKLTFNDQQYIKNKLKNLVGCKKNKKKNKVKYVPIPGLEPGPLTDEILSLACLPIPSYGFILLIIYLILKIYNN